MKVMSVAATVIIGLIALIFILSFFTTAKGGIQDISDSAMCRESVRMNSFLRYDEIVVKNPIKCPTLFIEVSSGKESVVFGTLALALSNTWNEFLQGTWELFDTSTQDYCVIRRVIEFKQKEKYNGFFDYLIENDVPGIKKSYFTYLTNINVDDGERALQNNLALQNADVIDTSTPYAAVFVQAKKENIGKIKGAEIGAGIGVGTGLIITGTLMSLTGIGAPVGIAIVGTGTAVGGATGFIMGSSYSANWDSSILLVPYTNESLKSLNCTKLPTALTKVQLEE